MLVYQSAVSLPGHAVSSMQEISSYHNVVKEPICTLPWQSLALDQLKYLQIAVNKFNVSQCWHNPLILFNNPPAYFRLL